MYKKISGIYKISSKINSKRIYVGSAINIKRRWNDHLSQLRKNIHHSPKMQSHFNKYGEEDLVFEILLTCEEKELIEKEQFFIDALKPWFNCCPTAGSQLGCIRTKESRKKMSDSAKCVKHTSLSPEIRQKISMGHMGKHQTEEMKQKLREYRTGKPMCEKTRQALLTANTGRILTEEHKQCISRANSGRIMSVETRKRMSRAASLREAKKRALAAAETFKKND